MIAYLQGKVLFEQDNALVIDVRGIGYKVFSTENTRNKFLLETEVSLYIHSVIKEQAFDLYGFENQGELYFFKKLTEVSGIGPKSALATLELASTDTLYQAIVNDNIAFLSSVPGIGKKTAERMCVELRDKLKDYQGNKDALVQDGDHDVIDALLALGYSSAQAHQTLASIPDDINDTQGRIKAALSVLS